MPQEAILEDLKSIFQDEELVAKVCDEVNKLLAAERPEIDRQLALLAIRVVRSRAEIARWQGISRARVTKVMARSRRQART